jgi:hypothetical protein
LWRGRELPGRATTINRHPNRRVAPVLRPIDFAHNEGNLLSVRRKVRVADEFKREIIFRCNSAWRLRNREANQTKNQTGNGGRFAN